jgi:alcohol dehydrogenase
VQGYASDDRLNVERTEARQVPTMHAGGDLELVERDVPTPGEVRVRVQARGVCHSDVFAVEGVMPATPFPIVPGHEVVGVVDEVGPDVLTTRGSGWC